MTRASASFNANSIEPKHDMHRHQFPLTAMLLDLASASPSRLAREDPKRMADHYGIREDWCREYLERARGVR